MKWMLMGLEAKAQWQKLSGAERDQRELMHEAAVRGLVVERAMVGGHPLALTAARLAPATEATTLRFRDGEMAAVEGPALETAEVLMRFDLLDFVTRDEAIGFARSCMVSDGNAIEVRPAFDDWCTYYGPGRSDAGRFMVIIIADAPVSGWSPEQNERTFAHHQQVGMEYTVDRGLTRREPLCFISGRLRPVAEAVTLRAQTGRSLVVDGPFAETKEAIAGFAIIDCASREEVIAWGRKLSAISHETLEIRRVESMWSIYHGERG